MKTIILNKDKYHFRVYESAPWSIEAWGRPIECSLLASTRLAGSNVNSTLNSNSVRNRC